MTLANKPAMILILDSGLGGLTLYREVAAALPDTAYVYVADDSFAYAIHGRRRNTRQTQNGESTISATTPIAIPSAGTSIPRQILR
jgi:glutamate racemase